MKLVLPLSLSLFISLASSQTRETLYLWPGPVPNQEEAKAPPTPEKNGEQSPLVQVTNPALVVYEPEAEVKNGAAVLILPGGGYNILAITKEGYEIAEWLNSLGYTAFVLQYRIPKNPDGALQDAQRAVRAVRATSHERGLDPRKIGVLGFSAGGSLAARISSRHDQSLYEPIDAYDKESARPDFLVLIYPAYLDRGEGNRLTPELSLSAGSPPTFLFVTADDPYANSSLVMAAALQAQKVPYELHVLPSGGHGYGMRPGRRASASWPPLAAEWMQLTLGKKEEK